jgi:serine/threonine protein kinase
MNSIISNKYKILNKLGSGEFGEIYKGENIRTKEGVAIKVEKKESQIKMLKREAQIYQYLGLCDSVPRVKWFGVVDEYYYMVLTLLGKNLTSFRKELNTISLNLVFDVGKNLVDIIEKIHEKKLLHRDVKPDNFLFGVNYLRNKIYLVDFGFCKKYVKEDGVTHIEMRKERPIIGTPNYVSLNIHDGIEPSRRDDLESIGYIMMFLLYNKLPWNDLISEFQFSYSEIMNSIKLKKQYIIYDNDVPIQIRTYIKYCRELEFKENPNYKYLKTILI